MYHSRLPEWRRGDPYPPYVLVDKYIKKKKVKRKKKSEMPDHVHCYKCDKDLFRLDEIYADYSEKSGITFQCRICGSEVVEKHQEATA